MFRLDDNFTEEDLSEPVKKAEENYLIQVNDYIELNLFTNDGERIIDPNPEIFSGNNNLNNRLNSRQQFEPKLRWKPWKKRGWTLAFRQFIL